MKVILTQDVRGKGKRGQMIEVSDGYARNFLLPKKLAQEANADNINTMRMNELASQTALLAERELGSAENQVVEIPLGAALGVSFLSGFGPRLEVQILPVGAVHTSFDTEFETAGINQTRHKIFLNLRATVSLIVPTGSQLVEVTSTVPIAESIIVGEVPESFVDVNNEEDMLNLIP